MRLISPLLTIFFICLGLASISCARRPDFNVSKFGAAGDGVTDDSDHLQAAINGCPQGGILDFSGGSGTYLISQTLTFRPNCTYSGNAILKMSPNPKPGTTAIGHLSGGQSSHVTFDGLTFDGSNVAGGLQIAASGPNIPGDSVVIQSCIFQNIKSGNPWEGSIYTPVGLKNSKITRNHFINFGGGIYIADPNSLEISYNEFDTATGPTNAISILVYAPTDQLLIRSNTGRRLRRMGVEVWGGKPGAALRNAVIRDNEFTDWSSDSDHDAFGISVTAGPNAEVSGNTLSHGRTGYGIEAGSPGMIVRKNAVTGFPIGIVVQGQPNVTVEGNKLTQQTDTAIFLSNSGNNLRTKLIDNDIENAHLAAIRTNNDDYQGSVFTGNEIFRAGGFFADDNAQPFPFLGFAFSGGLKGPITVRSNTITQSDPNPPPKFQFWAFALYAGVPNSVFEKNRVESKSTHPLGSAFNLWYAPMLDHADVSDNAFKNLEYISNGYTSKTVKTSNNSACNVGKVDRFLVNSDGC